MNGQHCALKSSTLDNIVVHLFGWQREQMATEFHFLLNIFFPLHIVEKLHFSLFLISCSQGILNASLLSWILLLKNACLHVSFTAYENFYKLSKMHCLLVLTFHFPIFRMSECRNPTIKHIFTYTLISPYISTYVIDLFLVILFT